MDTYIVTSNFQFGNQVHRNQGDNNYDILDLNGNQNELPDCVVFLRMMDSLIFYLGDVNIIR